MYSRFPKKAAEITSKRALEEAAAIIFESGKQFSELGQLFVDAETSVNIEERIRAAKEKFLTIAKMEEETFQNLAENIQKFVL